MTVDMKQLLRQISAGAMSLDALAKQFEVSTDAIRSRIDTLVSLGLLQDIDESCISSQGEDESQQESENGLPMATGSPTTTPACSGCSTEGACSIEPTAKLTGWKISAKGQRYIA